MALGFLAGLKTVAKTYATNAAVKSNNVAKNSIEAVKNFSYKTALWGKKVFAILVKAWTTLIQFCLFIISPPGLVFVGVALLAVNVLAATKILGPPETAGGCNSAGGVVVENTSTDPVIRGENIYKWLTITPFGFNDGKPLTREQAGGVIGNLNAESGLRADKYEGCFGEKICHETYDSNEKILAWVKAHPSRNGIGLAQWTNGRAERVIEFASTNGGNWWDVNMQLMFFKKELEESYGSRLKTGGFTDPTKTIDETTKIFHDIFEASADSAEKIAARADFGRKVTEMVGTSGGTGGSTIGGCGSLASGSMGAVASNAIQAAIPAVRFSEALGSFPVPQAILDLLTTANAKTGKNLPYMASCDFFVWMVVSTTLDAELPPTSTALQYNYLINSPKWKSYTDPAERQPGDVWQVRGGGSCGHALIYAGDVSGIDSIAQASIGSPGYHGHIAPAAPMIRGNSIRDDFCGGRTYVGFRYVG